MCTGQGQMVGVDVSKMWPDRRGSQSRLKPRVGFRRGPNSWVGNARYIPSTLVAEEGPPFLCEEDPEELVCSG